MLKRLGMTTKISSVAAATLCCCLATAQGLADLAKPMDGRSMRISSTFREGKDGKYDPHAKPKGDYDEKSNADNFYVAPGATHVLMDERGPGVITHIWLTFLGPERQNWAPNGSANHQEMLLRIYWDGDPRPGVEAPVGDFFAGCFGKRAPVISIPVTVEGGNAYNCFWPMPFRKSARIEIVNQSRKPINLLYYNIDWIKKDRISADTPYFYAQYRQEYPVAQGKDYVILDTKGKGHYVGTVLAVRTRSPGWFGEGDEKIYVDGERDASIWGTGTEDYFLSAWGLRVVNTPYFGVPYFDQWGIIGEHASAYRWHINDPIVFNKGIRVTIEHFGWTSPDENPNHKSMSWNERQDDYASVAYWYQTGNSTFDARAPIAAERTLSSLARIVVRPADVSVTHGEGRAEKQDLDQYAEPQLFYRPAKQDGWMEIPFEVLKKEPLRLLLNMTTSYDYGTYQAYLNGVRLGDPMDFYSTDVDNREFHLLDFWPDPGKYTLRLECVGKNIQSAGYYMGIESLRLRERRPRVAQYGWDKNKDWRKDPILYN